jgi:hypothetical protein
MNIYIVFVLISIIFLVLALIRPSTNFARKAGLTNRIGLSDRTENTLRKESLKLREDANERVIKKFGTLWVMPSALTILRIQNFLQFTKTFWRTPMIYNFRNDYSDVLVVFAIYEKHKLRADIKNALNELNQLGYSIFLVNSRKLSQESRSELASYVSIYMERPNYGRDFGSYKDAILWAFKNLKDQMPLFKRLLILNDSVFYSRNDLQQFFSNLTESQSPVYGATINYQKIPHIGSFCLSVTKEVIQNKKFKKYWKKYRKTDLRAHTIKYGELALSRLLAKISPGDPPLEVLFSGHEITRRLQEDEQLLKTIHNASRNSERSWDALRSNIRVEMVRMDYHVQLFGSESFFESGDNNNRLAFAGTFDDGFEAFKSGTNGNENELLNIYRKSLIAFIGDDFEKRSQIHQNATILPYLGCPIIKLDLEFRGVTNTFDRMTICEALHPDDAKEFSRLLSTKPWGETSLSGWRLAAFQWGHL